MIDVIILAGGQGTRLRQIVSDRPKPLAEVAGRPFLDLLLQQLKSSACVSRVILSLGYRASQVIEYYSSNLPPLPLDFSIENEPLLTGGALRLALEQATTPHILVMNGDSFLNFSLPSLLSFHREKEADLTLCTIKTEDSTRFGSVDFDSNTNRIQGFSEKNDKREGSWINGGVYLLDKNLLDDYPLHHPFSLEKEAFPRFLEKKVYSYPCVGLFIDIGTVDSYQKAQTLLKNISL